MDIVKYIYTPLLLIVLIHEKHKKEEEEEEGTRIKEKYLHKCRYLKSLITKYKES